MRSLTSLTNRLPTNLPNTTIRSTKDFEMEAGSSSSSAALAAAPQTSQTASKLVGRPYRKRAKNAVLNDPTLEQVMGSKEKALDVSTSRPLVQLELIQCLFKVEEFPPDSPLNLDNEDKGHWIRLRKGIYLPVSFSNTLQTSKAQNAPCTALHLEQKVVLLPPSSLLNE